MTDASKVLASLSPLERKLNMELAEAESASRADVARLVTLVRRYAKVRGAIIHWRDETDRLSYEWKRYTPREREDPTFADRTVPIWKAASRAAKKLRQSRKLEVRCFSLIIRHPLVHRGPV